MTGHGEARLQGVGCNVWVEVRTVNNKFFKLTLRTTDRLAALESAIENLVRDQVRRGSVQVSVQIQRESTPDDYRLNEVVLASYRRQLEAIEQHLKWSEPIRLESLLGLPGVVDERATQSTDVEQQWPLVERALRTALEHLHRMRLDEGRSLLADLQSNRQAIAAELAQIEQLAPNVVAAYRQKLLDRSRAWAKDLGIEINPADIAREIGLFADRSDISEEIVRLRSHLEQFDSILRAMESSGRKLEFLTQEMFRETNTIGSKANDTQINLHVIEIKTAIERLREMIQNVE
jgi:uncharacterized protein (TIGR00255 family)